MTSIWKCVCGWVAKPGDLVKCDSPVDGPYYCPECNKHINKEELAYNSIEVSSFDAGYKRGYQQALKDEHLRNVRRVMSGGQPNSL